MKKLIKEFHFKSFEHDKMAKTCEEVEKEMGKLAYDALNKDNFNVVVEGPFHQENKLKDFFNNSGRKPSDNNVVILRLECSVETAISRNKYRAEQVPEEKINNAYQNNLLDVREEKIFNTDNGINNALIYIKEFIRE